MPSPPTIDDIRAAHARIKPLIVRTPLIANPELDARTGGRVFVKAENLQRGGAFKRRGAASAITALAAEARSRGVLAYSSGNHAIAVASVARELGAPAVIVMPSDAPRIKYETTVAMGAEVVLYDRVTESREGIGEALARERGLSLVRPFDDPNVIAGQGTAGLEIGEEIAPEIVITPGSGGGLAAGLALALPNARVVVVEPQGHDDIARSLAAGRLERNAPGVRSICDGLLTERIGDLPYEVARHRFSAAIAMSDDAARRAMKFAFFNLKLVLEPSGAIALAAALEGGLDLKGETVAILASGGNVDAETFAEAISVPDANPASA